MVHILRLFRRNASLRAFFATIVVLIVVSNTSFSPICVIALHSMYLRPISSATLDPASVDTGTWFTVRNRDTWFGSDRDWERV